MLPADGLAVLAVIGSAAIDAVHGQIIANAAAIERRLQQRGIAREENPLVAADRSAVGRPHVLSLRPERGAHEVEQVRFK